MSWSLKKLRFLLGHIGDFVDSDWEEIRERAKHFSPQTGLSQIQNFENATGQPAIVLDRLAPFFESGLLLHKTSKDWAVTDVLWRGSVFHLQTDEQMSASSLITEFSPLQVKRAPADLILKTLDLDILSPGPDAQGYMLKPAPETGYILISNLADPWAADHVAQAHRLINKSFVY
jgi:hypothetical protein